MKSKLTFSIAIFLYLSIYEGQAKIIIQKSDSLIKVTGIITSKEENSPINARIFYEKLPYYDDMGIATSKKESGKFEMYMLLGKKYMVEVKSDGFETIKNEITIVDDGSGLMSQNFELETSFVNKKITIKNLNFARGRSMISTSSYAGLDEFVSWLKARPTAIVQLEGHTDLDIRGNAKANLQLSLERVDAVKSYLGKNGIKKSRVRTKAFGGTQPLTKERTPEARALNRRVEVQVLQN